MHFKNKIIITVLLSIVVLAACKSALYVPTNENSGANVHTLTEGRKLYINKCSSCHSLYLPEQYNKTEWRKWVNNMAERSHISEEEKEKIYTYLTKGK
jgi:cytochrome c5